MSLLESRFFMLFRPAANLADLARQVEALRFTLTSAIQDIAAMKALLQEKGVGDPASYKRLRVGRMIEDHDTAGASPWLYFSLYPYTLEETEFLKHQFRATETEVEDFREKVKSVESAT